MSYRQSLVAALVIALGSGATTTPIVGMFGYVTPKTDRPLTQPVLNRYAAELQLRLVTAIPMNLMPVSAAGENLDPCKTPRLSGYFEPHRRWRITDQTVTVDTTLTIFDCQGNMFYRGHTMRAQQRDPDVEPQTQIDRTQAEAEAALVQNFTRFVKAHQSAWTDLLCSGSISGAP